MRRSVLAAVGGFVTMFFAASGIAVAMRPWIGPMLAPYVRSDSEGLAFVPLISGYIVIAAVVGWLSPRVESGQRGWRHGAFVGLSVGVPVFLGDHLVTAGWSKLPALPMVLSGLMDSLSVGAGGIVVALIRDALD